jgi:hypothetical protein
MSYLNHHFHSVAGSPRPLSFHAVFSGSHTGSSYTSNISELLQQLIHQVDSQNAVVSGLISKITGSGGGSAIENLLGGSSFGGSALGSLANAAKGGFSWESIVKDIFPIGGLISGLASLFSSTPTPPPLRQYDAPPSLNFNAVLNSNGSLSQGSADQYGHTRAASPGLDLLDAQGGPYSPYRRASNGSLLPVSGDPVGRYSGTLNLPEMDLKAMLQPLVQIAPQAGANSATSTALLSSFGQTTYSPSQSGARSYGGTNDWASSFSSPASGNTGSSTPGSTPVATEHSSSRASLTADPGNQSPSFDQQWFNDHGTMIASAVRTELLNFHPIVDVINNL